MASKKAVVMKVAVLAFVLALSSTVISARPDAHVLDLFDLLSAAESHVSNNFVVRGKNEGNSIACCDACACTKSNPPKCKCYDTFSDTNRCEGCDACICAVTYPPICRCYDTTESCSPVCSADAAANSVLKRSIVAPN
ncbi:seed trypsin/chymotrypsin inhibitor IVA [Ziziphus jujuba]|uniref:Seed trypsin/chymotrypsin inhibitor IVA n=1 Tax=Ziziphus jujuba TaxID=326968 RepID=A0ABM3IKH1_ZIZJJ|nr:seed trypsin/chymotrypsin inhibitor IVA [Ziziphus jujuba]